MKLFGICLVVLLCVNIASVDGVRGINIDFVFIGNAGNPGDTRTDDPDSAYPYGCGTAINQSKANYKFGLGAGDYCNPLGLSSYPYTSPVNHYSSYGYGLNDMAGNVWEWTDSLYSSSPGGVRGGSWFYDDSLCTVSFRGIHDWLDPSDNVGFRVCR